MGSPQQAAELRKKLNASLTFLADAEQEAYRAYGLPRGTVSQVFGPRVLLPLLRGVIRGGVGKPIGDVWQMPGAFVIDRQGIIRYTYYPSIQTRRPTNDELTAALESIGD